MRAATPETRLSSENPTYVRSHAINEMFQRCQKSCRVWAAYGHLKFSGKRNPSIRPSPMAMSE